MLPVNPPIKPMLAKAIPAIPEAGGLSFEPKWDGFRCIVFRDGDEVFLGSRNERPLTRYFPELIEPLRGCLPDKVVVDGEIIVVLDDHLAFDALQQRIHPADSRVEMLSVATPAQFVAFDLLALGDDDLMGRSFAERRSSLESISPAFEYPVHLVDTTRDTATATGWYKRFEGAGLDGLIAKPLDGVYAPNKRAQFKIKHTRTADVVVAGYRIHKDGEGVGSLVVGIHDDDGRLQHMGVAASFAAGFRRELLQLLAPHILKDPTKHPWSEWMDVTSHRQEVMPGTPHRWSGAGGNQSWTPLDCRLVVEVKYESTLNGRFRGTTRFVRWRPDREPATCRLDQLEVPIPVAISEVLGSTA
ncbi:MAG: ATP-dependent DNA ligase [Actinomycetia bacterium]|nr:ATP-dependent DNA ligase [Actinomycetes bacterium]